MNLRFGIVDSLSPREPLDLTKSGGFNVWGARIQPEECTLTVVLLEARRPYELIVARATVRYRQNTWGNALIFLPAITIIRAWCRRRR